MSTERKPRPRIAPDVDELVATRLHALRLHAGVSRPALAVRIGVSVRTIQAYETHRMRMRCGTASAIALTLGSTLADVLPGNMPEVTRADALRVARARMSAERADIVREALQ